MRRLLSLLTLAIVMLVPRTSEACTCPIFGPPCQEVWKSPVVFAGTVIQVDRAPGAFGPRRVRFRITEAFRGTEKGEMDIHLRGGGGPSCDPPFRMGESWLVYANSRGEGGAGWTTSTCSRTRLLRQAAEDVSYLRLPDAQKPPGHIAGRVTRHAYDFSQRRGGESVPVAGVPVILTNRMGRRETKTDRDGRYSIPVELRDAYQVEFGRVEGLVIRAPVRELRLPHDRACAVVDASALYDGRLSGRIVDDRGRPVPFLPITLLSSPRLLQQHMLTDEEGRFRFAEVYPVAYDVAPSTSLWQEPRALPELTWTPVTVAPAGRIDIGPLRIPPSLKLSLVEIVIEDSEGKPASGARVTFRQPDDYHTIESAPLADQAGRFRVSVIPGRYLVEAGYTRKTRAGAIYETGKVLIDAPGLTPIRLRLARSR